MSAGQDSLKTRRTLEVNGTKYDYYSLEAAAAAGIGDISRLPFSLKVLLENLLRYEDGNTVTVEDIRALGAWTEQKRSDRERSLEQVLGLFQVAMNELELAEVAQWDRVLTGFRAEMIVQDDQALAVELGGFVVSTLMALAGGQVDQRACEVRPDHAEALSHCESGP